MGNGSGSGIGRHLIAAHLHEGRSVGEIAQAHGVHRSWLYKLLRRYRADGEKGLLPRSPGSATPVPTPRAPTSRCDTKPRPTAARDACPLADQVSAVRGTPAVEGAARHSSTTSHKLHTVRRTYSTFMNGFHAM